MASSMLEDFLNLVGQRQAAGVVRHASMEFIYSYFELVELCLNKKKQAK
jgi:hypothetical protein